MAITGTATWNMSVDDMIQEAAARCGGADITGWEVKSLRQSLNLMGAEFAAYGVNMWARDRQVISLVAGTARYQLPADTISVRVAWTRQPSGSIRANGIATVQTAIGSPIVTISDPNHGALPGDYIAFPSSVTVGGLTLLGQYLIASAPTTDTLTFTASNAVFTDSVSGVSVAYPSTTDLSMAAMSEAAYSSLASKNIPGSPYNYWFNRLIVPELWVFPTPDLTPVTQIAYIRQRRLSDINSNSDNVEVPIYCVPAVNSWLAFKLAEKRPGVVDSARRQELYSLFKDDLSRAMTEDHDRSPMEIRPDLSGYYR
jgi:hypothetical protein